LLLKNPCLSCGLPPTPAPVANAHGDGYSDETGGRSGKGQGHCGGLDGWRGGYWAPPGVWGDRDLLRPPGPVLRAGQWWGLSEGLRRLPRALFGAGRGRGRGAQGAGDGLGRGDSIGRLGGREGVRGGCEGQELWARKLKCPCLPKVFGGIEIWGTGFGGIGLVWGWALKIKIPARGVCRLRRPPRPLIGAGRWWGGAGVRRGIRRCCPAITFPLRRGRGSASLRLPPGPLARAEQWRSGAVIEHGLVRGC